MERTDNSNHSFNVAINSDVSPYYLPDETAAKSNGTATTQAINPQAPVERDLLSEAELGLFWLHRRAELVRLEIQAIELELALQHARQGETGSLLAWLQKNGTPWQEHLSVEPDTTIPVPTPSTPPHQPATLEIATNSPNTKDLPPSSDPVERLPKQTHEPIAAVPHTKPRSQKKPYTNIAQNEASSSSLAIPLSPVPSLPNQPLKAQPEPAQSLSAQPPVTIPQRNSSPTNLTQTAPNREPTSKPIASAITPAAEKKVAPKNTRTTAAQPRQDNGPTPSPQAKPATASTHSKKPTTNQPPTRTQHKVTNKTKPAAKNTSPSKLSHVKQLPSWIVSSVVHAVLLLILLLFTIPLPKQKEKLGLSGTFEPNTNTSLQLENSATQPTDEMQNQELSEAISASESLENVLQSSLPSASDIAANSLASPDLAGTLSPPAAEGLGELKDVLDGKFVDNLSTTNSLASANFFGLEATGNIFCFVVDCSGSMRGDPFVATKQELLKTISQLKPNQRFCVLFFNQKVFPMDLGDQPAPTAVPAAEDFRPEAVHATPENLMRLQRWMETVQIGSGGPPNQALKIAIKLEPDSIYLLTDGVTRSDVAGNLLKTNRQEDELDGPQIRCPIHTIGFYSTEGEALLQRIATENGGQYRYVPNPKPPKKSKKMEGGS